MQESHLNGFTTQLVLKFHGSFQPLLNGLMTWSKETSNYMNGSKDQDHTHSGWEVSSILKVSWLQWSNRLQECTKQANQSEVDKSNHHGHWMMLFTRQPSKKKIKNRLKKVETRMSKECMSDSWFWKVPDGTRTVCKLQDQEKCSLLCHYCTSLPSIKRNPVMTNQFTTVPFINTQREPTSTLSLE